MGFTINCVIIHFLDIKKSYRIDLYHFMINAIVVQMNTKNNKTTLFFYIFFNPPAARKGGELLSSNLT